MPPAVGRIAAPRAWPLLIKVYWAIRIWYEVCVCLGLSEFSFFLQEHCGHWGIFWEGHHAASGCCSIDMPSSHSHSLLALGDFWEGHHAASGCCSIAMPSSHSTPTLLWLGLLLPLSTAIHLPIPNHQVWQCFAHIKHLKHKPHYFGLGSLFPSPLPLVHSLTLPQQVSSAIHGLLVVCMGHLGVHIMWVLKSAHHDTHSAVLVLGFLPQYLFFCGGMFFFLSFFVLGVWRLWILARFTALSCLLVSFHFFIVLLPVLSFDFDECNTIL